ncbi:MAG: hypothetical protein HQK54_16205, partial [Oligoflexales bacterium]|nr:hypothetical protein [Oligoflexales bacterium]
MMDFASLVFDEGTFSLSGRRFYLAIQADGLLPETSAVLTPRFMLWEENTFILDMTPVTAYWETKAARAGCDLAGILRRVLLSALNQGNNDPTTVNFIAVLAVHPWRALLLASFMKERGLSGFLSLGERISESLYEQISWENLWEGIKIFSSHAKGVPGFNSSDILKNMRKMKNSVEKLGLSAPSKLEKADFREITRRYGQIIGWLWETAFKYRQNTFTGSGCHRFAFPWHDYKFPITPSHTRHLEYPVASWSEIEQFLCEDLNIICSLESLEKNEQVTDLKWHLVFHDMSSLSLSIIFRHPHDLHSEVPHHKTSLLQIYYKFKAATLDREFLPLVSWEISISGKIKMPSSICDIFGEKKLCIDELIQLENRLPIKLHGYSYRSDCVPEHSFREISQPAGKADFIGESYLSLKALGRKRPLFFYKKPLKYEDFPEIKTGYFLEKTMEKWW